MDNAILRRARLGAASVTLALAAAAGHAEFKDPLTTPAVRSERVLAAPMTAVARTGPAHLVAAGWRGTIAYSQDDGKTWKQAAVPVREDLTALAFTSPEHGWAVGNEGVLLETADGGQTWAKRLDGHLAARLMVDKYSKLAQAAPDDKALAAALKESEGYLAQAPSRPFLDVAFENEDTGYIVGAYNMVFRTTDAGKTWEPWFEKTDNPNGYNLYALHIEGGEVYIAGELGLALRLDRTAGRFVKLTTPYEGSFFTLAGKAPTLLVAGLRGNALRSEDAGRNWQKVDFAAAAPATFSGSATLADGRIVLVTSSGQIFVSSDGGQHFSPVAAKSPMRYSGVAAAGPDSIVVVGTQGIRTEALR